MFRTRLTALLGIRHPVVLAPMGTVAGGALAAAVSTAGGLGQVGVGYGDRDLLVRELARAAGARVGCGFITWRLVEQPDLLDVALAHGPAAVTLSFGDPAPFAARIRAAGVPVICQVAGVEEAHGALDCGADVLVAQGGEGGGHGRRLRSTMTLLPEVVDLVAARGADVPVLAAGGVSDGRGLAAALVLGADGVMVGTRFWACREAVVAPAAQRQAVAATGDDTLPTTVYDRVRGYTWPAGYTSRVLRTPFVQRWHGRDDELTARLDELAAQYRRAAADEDFDVAQILVGEGVGAIDAVRPAAEVLAELVDGAAAALAAHRPATSPPARGPGPAVVGGVLLHEGRVLLCHRHPGRRWFPGVWDLPGGHVEPGESDVVAMVRELGEELGVHVAETDLDEVTRVPLPDDGGAAGGLMSVFRVRRWDREPTNRRPDEHDDLGWFGPDELVGLDLPDPAYHGLLRRLLECPR